MNNEIREQVLGVVAGLRGEKRASKGKAIGRTLRRGWELLSGSRADRLAGAKARLTKELRRLGYQMETLTKDLDRSSPDPRNWSLPQTGQLGMPPLFSKNQAKVLNSSKWPSAASQNKALDAEIAAIGRRSSARRDALQHVGRLLDREQRAVDAARITGVAAGGAGLGAGYGLHSLLGGKGDGEKKAAELLGVDPARLEKRAAKGNAAAKALRWVKAYMGRGSKLRGAIRNAERANADLAGKGQRLQELLSKRTTDAALLRKYRPLAGEVKRLAATGELVGHGKMTRLNDEYFRLANESRLGRPSFLMGLGYPSFSGGFDVSGGVAFPKTRLDSGDLAQIKAFLAPHRSVKADKQAIEELKQYLGTHSVRSTDVLRSRLRKYHLANTAAGVATAAGLGGAGYGAYRATSGESKTASVRLAKQAQQRPMSRADQQTLARMKALSAQLRGSTSPTVTRGANGTVTSTWRGYIPPASGSSGQAPAAAPVQRPAAAPVQRPAPAAGTVAPPSRRIQGLRVIAQPERIPQ